MINDSSISSSTFLSTTNGVFKKRKIMVLGGPGVGKSAIIMRFKDDKFFDFYDPSIPTKFKKAVNFNNEVVELELIDVDGQTEYTIFSFSKFSFGIHGYILTYSIESRQSFDLVKIIHSKLCSLVGRDVPKILVANKCDLNEKRVITFEEGKKLSEQMNCSFIECSAKNCLNIERLFQNVLVEIYKYENNVDLKELGCKKVFQFFVKYESKLLILLYILISYNLLFGVYCLVNGFLTGVQLDVKTVLYGGELLMGLWTIIFSFLGFYAVCKKKKEFLNYYSIGILINVTINLALFIYGYSVDTNYKENVFLLILEIVAVLVELFILFFSCIFQKMYKDELNTYMIV